MRHRLERCFQHLVELAHEHELEFVTNFLRHPVELPGNVSIFDNVDGMTGGIQLWDDED